LEDSSKYPFIWKLKPVLTGRGRNVYTRPDEPGAEVVVAVAVAVAGEESL